MGCQLEDDGNSERHSVGFCGLSKKKQQKAARFVETDACTCAKHSLLERATVLVSIGNASKRHIPVLAWKHPRWSRGKHYCFWLTRDF